MTIRASTDADKTLAEGWWRGPAAFCAAAVPPIGCVCEDEDGPCGAVWLHLSAKVEGGQDAPGVAFLEYLVMRPGLQVAQAAATGAALMRGVESAAKALGYGLLVAYSLPACARYLRSMGWSEGDPRAKIAMLKQI